jgi:large subunit ribosomal protein L10
MAITKAQKKEIFDKISKIADDSKAVVFVNFKGMKVADATALRRTLKKSGVGYYVAKKSVAQKALEGKKYDGVMPELAGEVGFVYASDLTAPARETHLFGKGKKEGFPIILGGIFDGKFKSKEEMMEIALIPGMETLRGMFVNLINSPIQGLVIALDAVAKKKTA